MVGNRKQASLCVEVLVNIISKLSWAITSDVMSAVPSCCVFLKDDEVVINLKGPYQIIKNAQVHIQNQFKIELSSKDILLPTHLSTEFQKNLEAVAKKHIFVKCKVKDQGATLPQVLLVGGELVQAALTELQGIISLISQL